MNENKKKGLAILGATMALTGCGNPKTDTAPVVDTTPATTQVETKQEEEKVEEVATKEVETEKQETKEEVAKEEAKEAEFVNVYSTMPTINGANGTIYIPYGSFEDAIIQKITAFDRLGNQLLPVIDTSKINFMVCSDDTGSAYQTTVRVTDQDGNTTSKPLSVYIYWNKDTAFASNAPTPSKPKVVKHTQPKVNPVEVAKKDFDEAVKVFDLALQSHKIAIAHLEQTTNDKLATAKVKQQAIENLKEKELALTKAEENVVAKQEKLTKIHEAVKEEAQYKVLASLMSDAGRELLTKANITKVEEEKLATETEKLKELKETLATKQQELERIEDEILALDTSVKENTAKLKELETKQRTCEEEKEQISFRLASQTAQLNTLRENLKTNTEFLAVIGALEEATNELKAKQDASKITNDELVKAANAKLEAKDNVDRLKEVLQSLENIQLEILNTQNEIDALTAAMPEKQQAVTDAENAVNTATTEVDNAQKDVTRKAATLEAKEQQIIDKQKELEAAEKAKDDAIKALDEITRQYETKTQAHTNAVKTLERVTREKAEAQRAVDAAQTEVDARTREKDAAEQKVTEANNAVIEAQVAYDAAVQAVETVSGNVQERENAANDANARLETARQNLENAKLVANTTVAKLEEQIRQLQAAKAAHDKALEDKQKAQKKIDRGSIAFFEETASEYEKQTIKEMLNYFENSTDLKDYKESSAEHVLFEPMSAAALEKQKKELSPNNKYFYKTVVGDKYSATNLENMKASLAFWKASNQRRQYENDHDPIVGFGNRKDLKTTHSHMAIAQFRANTQRGRFSIDHFDEDGKLLEGQGTLGINLAENLALIENYKKAEKGHEDGFVPTFGDTQENAFKGFYELEKMVYQFDIDFLNIDVSSKSPEQIYKIIDTSKINKLNPNSSTKEPVTNELIPEALRDRYNKIVDYANENNFDLDFKNVGHYILLVDPVSGGKLDYYKVDTPITGVGFNAKVQDEGEAPSFAFFSQVFDNGFYGFSEYDSRHAPEGDVSNSYIETSSGEKYYFHDHRKNLATIYSYEEYVNLFNTYYDKVHKSLSDATEAEANKKAALDRLVGEFNVTSAENGVAELQEKLEIAKNQKVTSSEAITAAEEAVREAEEAARNANDALTAANSAKAEAEGIMNDKKSELDDKKAKLDEANQSLEAAEAKVREATNALQSANANVDAKTQALAKAEAAKAEAERVLADAQQPSDEQRAELERLAEAVTNATSALHAAEEEQRQAQTALDAANKVVEDKEAEKQRLEAELEEKRDAVTSATSALEEKNAHLEKINDDDDIAGKIETAKADLAKGEKAQEAAEATFTEKDAKNKEAEKAVEVARGNLAEAQADHDRVKGRLDQEIRDQEALVGQATKDLANKENEIAETTTNINNTTKSIEDANKQKASTVERQGVKQNEIDATKASVDEQQGVVDGQQGVVDLANDAKKEAEKKNDAAKKDVDDYVENYEHQHADEIKAAEDALEEAQASQMDASQAHDVAKANEEKAIAADVEADKALEAAKENHQQASTNLEAATTNVEAKKDTYEKVSGTKAPSYNKEENTLTVPKSETDPFAKLS